MAIHVSNKLYRLTVQRPPKQISTRKNTIVASPCHIDRVCRVQHRFLPILFGRLRRKEIIAFKFVAKILSRSNSTKQNGQTKFVAAKLSLQHRREHSGPGGQRQPVSLSRWQFSSRHRRMEWQRNHWQRQYTEVFSRIAINRPLHCHFAANGQRWRDIESENNNGDGVGRREQAANSQRLLSLSRPTKHEIESSSYL